MMGYRQIKQSKRAWAAAGLLGLTLPVSATQVCTTQSIGKTEYRGISGSSDATVLAVGKGGTISQYDGAAWSTITMPGGKDLNDVEMFDDNTAFAVGQDGTVFQLSNGSWQSQTGFTKNDLYGVWAAAASEAYVVGEKGTIYAYDGAAWTDQSAAAGTGKAKLTDAWGDAGSFYALGDKGELFRYDRVTGIWDAPDMSCAYGGGFEDLWGDGAGNLYLVRNDKIYLHDGTSCSLVNTASEKLQGVYGWSANGELYAVGKNGLVVNFDGAIWTEQNDVTGQEIKDDWVSPSGNAYYAGKKGELTVCQCVGCANPQFTLNHDGYGINCLAETIQASVLDTSTGLPRSNYSQQVMLDTQTGFGTWTLLAGSGAFVDAVANDGVASYDWPMGESSALFGLSYPEGLPDLDIDLYQASDPGLRDDDSEGVMTFSPSGFTVTAVPLGNPPPPIITTFASAQVAGTNFPLYVAAYGQTPTDSACGIIEAYTGVKDLSFWFSFQDPGSGTRSVSIDGIAVPADEAATTVQNIEFANGQAAVTAKYKDVGRIQILLKQAPVADPDLPDGIRGATAGFVVKPSHFQLSHIQDAAGNPNPGAADAAGPVFAAAGDPFSVTVAAYDAEGDLTPNYGQESIPETVLLTPSLVSPAAGNTPAIGAAAGFGPFAGGEATGNDFFWPEVGIVTLTPSVGDASYFDAGDVAGLPSGLVGRFIPHHFSASLNSPQFASGCAAGSFTYIGAAFDYAIAPVVSLTAEAASGATTQNYTGAFFKIDNSSLANRAYAAASGTLDTSGLPAATADPAIADLGGGEATLTFSAGTGLAFDRGAPESPFDANIQLSIDVLDLDSVAATGNPVTFGDPGGIDFDNGANMRYGRVRLFNALGSELVNLNVSMRAEYFVDAATGFVTHADDVCTSDIDLTMDAFTLGLNPGETCVLDTGSPGDSGSGCAAAGPIGQQYREPPLAGLFNLYLQAPGAGNSGSTKVTASVPDWLKFDWDSVTPLLEDPSGTATFGIFQGENQRIYTREVY